MIRESCWRVLAMSGVCAHCKNKIVILAKYLVTTVNCVTIIHVLIQRI